MNGHPDDDLLVERLRARAHDPARRFDEAPVPVAWIERHHGPERVEEALESGHTFSGDGMVLFPAGSREAVDHHRGAPRRPPFPPATFAELAEAERGIGHRLPEPLRRVYTEVADGGFGPDARGFARINGGSPSLADLHERDQSRGLPPSWLELTPAGCTLSWYVWLTGPGNPVLLHDIDSADPRRGERPEDGVVHVTGSLRSWLWTWADGGDVWDDVRRG